MCDAATMDGWKLGDRKQEFCGVFFFVIGTLCFIFKEFS